MQCILTLVLVLLVLDELTRFPYDGGSYSEKPIRSLGFFLHPLALVARRNLLRDQIAVDAVSPPFKS